MKRRLSMLFASLTALMLIVCAVFALSSPGIVTASRTSVAAPKPGPHTPHAFYKPGSRQYAQNLGVGNLTYHSGSVMSGTVHVYAIFWEPTGNVSTNYNSLIQRYFGDMGGSPLYAINSQYTQTGGGFSSNSVLSASWVDSQAFPESPLLDTDIQNEVTRAQQVNSWSSGIDNIFFVFTERGENLCFDASKTQCASNTFCAYHNYYGNNNTIYAAMPYAASFSCDPGTSPNNNEADQTINVTSHEQMEAATDPYLNAWYDSAGYEIGDKCAWIFGSLNGQGADVTWNSNPYIVQEEWNDASSSCRLSPSTQPTPTPIPPTPTPNPTVNLIKNGGFESGKTNWTESSSGLREIVDTTHPHTGTHEAHLCGYNNCRETIYQTVSIPSNVTSATLSYYWYVTTSESTHSFDFLYARVRTTGSSTLSTLQTLSDGSSTGSWHHATYNLLAYKGKTVQIAFVSTNNASRPTNFYIDDVSLNVH